MVLDSGFLSHFTGAPRSTLLQPTGTMATKLDKSIKRELEHKGQVYTITISPEGVKVVPKGRRNGTEVSWDSIISGDATLNANLNASVNQPS